MEVLGYKKTYSYIIRGGFQNFRYSQTFDSKEKGDEWVKWMKHKFEGYGGCHLEDVFEYDTPVYAKKEVKPLELIYETEEQRLKRERRLERE